MIKGRRTQNKIRLVSYALLCVMIMLTSCSDRHIDNTAGPIGETDSTKAPSGSGSILQTPPHSDGTGTDNPAPSSTYTIEPSNSIGISSSTGNTAPSQSNTSSTPNRPQTPTGSVVTDKPTSKPTSKPTDKPTMKPTDSGFSWDQGGNYTGTINIKKAQTTGNQVSKGGAIIDVGNSSQGYVLVKKSSDTKTKVRVIGPGGKTYQRYILSDKDVFYPIPLQMGNGSYTIGVMQLVSGSSYIKLVETTINVNISTEYYMYPNIYADYDEKSEAVRKGFGLCMNAKTDLDKVKSVYNFIINNISYDYDKAADLKADYVPDPDKTLSSRKGICFDYACLMATMLRSQGIPTKIVFGYAGKVFHAWNEVYIESVGWVSIGISSKGGWKRLDSTFGVSTSSSYLENDSNYSSLEYY